MASHRAERDNSIYVTLYQVGRERGELFGATVGVSALDLQVLTLAVAEFTQNLDEIARASYVPGG